MKALKYQASAIAMVLLLSGCVLWRDFKRPETPTPQAWDGAQAAAAWPSPEWWAGFGPPLTELMAKATAANLDLQAAEARVRQADAQLKIAGAALLPSVGLDAGATRSKSASGSFGAGAARNSFTAALSASYELDFWGKNYATEQAAAAALQASKYDREVVALTMEVSVADTYFDWLATRQREAITQLSIANARYLLDVLHRRFAEGTASALDVAQQENLLATQTAALPPLVLQERQDLDALAILLGVPPEGFSPPDASVADLAFPSVAPGLPSELLARRPDVAEAEANLAQAHANIIVARASFLPSITLTGERGFASPALSSLLEPNSILYSFGASLVQPIFEGGILEGGLELTQAQYDELLADYRKSAISAFSDVENALAAVQQATAQEAAQQQAVDTAQHAYSLSQDQLAAGIVDISSVLNTQTTLLAAQNALAQAKLSHLQAIVQLYQALGGGFSTGQATPPG